MKKFLDKHYLAVFGVVLLLVIASHQIDQKICYNEGYNDGVSATLDTVSIIVGERVDNTLPAVTKLVLKDTVTYYLSKKTLGIP